MSQIRIANKQDDSQIRALCAEALKSQSIEFDLNGRDQDLKNVEWTYFGHDGIFLVVEFEGAVAGYAGATKLTEEAIQIKRFLIRPLVDVSATGGLLLDMLIKHAKNMDYKTLVFEPEEAASTITAALESKSFAHDGSHRWVLKI